MSSVSRDKQSNLVRCFKADSMPWIIDALDGSFMTDMVFKSRTWSFQPEHGVRRRPRNSPEASAPNYVVRLFLT